MMMMMMTATTGKLQLEKCRLLREQFSLSLSLGFSFFVHLSVLVVTL
jgi:hypothetical protein